MTDQPTPAEQKIDHPERSPIEANSKDPQPSSSAEKATVPAFFRWLTYLVLIPLIALSTTFFGCISLICGLWDKSGRQQHFIAHIWARSLLLISLSPVRLINKEKLHEHETAVYASNHLSYYDTPVLFAKLPFQFRILATGSIYMVGAIRTLALNGGANPA